MQHQDRPRFANLMKAIGETFGNAAPSKEKMELYFKVLSDLSIEQVESAVYFILNTRTITSTFPVPGEIRAALSGGKSAAMIALDKAERAVERYGVYESVVFDDPVIHMVIAAMGGWKHFCCPSEYGDNQEWHWKQKQFIELYETFSKNPRANCPMVLIGIGDTEYYRDGKTIQIQPNIVGNKDQAMLWQESMKSTKLENNLVKQLVP